MLVFIATPSIPAVYKLSAICNTAVGGKHIAQTVRGGGDSRPQRFINRVFIHRADTDIPIHFTGTQ